MSNASLKEQLQAVASQLSDKRKPEHKAVNKPRPQEQNGKQKPKWLDYVQYGVELLRAYYPEAFRAQNDIKPLKKGIKQDLVKRLSTMEGVVTEDKACMVKSLSYYVNTAAYHKSMVEGTPRIDLDGKAEGVVTAEEAKYSQDRQQAKILARQQTKADTKPA